MRKKIFSTQEAVQAAVDTYEPNPNAKADLMKGLKAKGIDTKVCQYELAAESYERYERGNQYKVKFKCAGDYLAFWSMYLHEAPSPEEIYDYMYDYTEGDDPVAEWTDKYPTVDAMREYATSVWWGDGDDYIYYVKNLTTGETIYDGGEPEGEEYEDEEDYWED